MRIFTLSIIAFFCVFAFGCGEQKTQEQDFSIIYGSWKTEEPNSLTSKNDTITITKDSVQHDRLRIRQVTYFMQNDSIAVHPIDAPEGIAWFNIIPQSNGRLLIKDKVLGDKIFVRTTPADIDTILNTEVETPNSKPISLKR